MHEIAVTWVNSDSMWIMIRTDLHRLVRLVVMPVPFVDRSHIRSVGLTTWFSVCRTCNGYRSVVV